VGKELQVRPVKTAVGNDFFVEVTEGLKEGEQVLRTPRAVAALVAEVQSAAPRPARVLVRSVRLPSESEGRRARIEYYGLTMKDLERIKALSDVTAVVPMRMILPMDTRRLERKTLGPVIATVPYYREQAGIELAAGRFLDHADDMEMKNVAVIGASVAERLFPGENPVGEVVRLGRNCTAFVVVGVLQEQNRTAHGIDLADLNHGVFIPLRTCRGRFGEQVIVRQSGSYRAEAVAVSEILVETGSGRQAEYVGACITALLEASHSKKDWAVRVVGGE
jgi:hypothetical protein